MRPEDFTREERVEMERALMARRERMGTAPQCVSNLVERATWELAARDCESALSKLRAG